LLGRLIDSSRGYDVLQMAPIKPCRVKQTARLSTGGRAPGYLNRLAAANSMPPPPPRKKVKKPKRSVTWWDKDEQKVKIPTTGGVVFGPVKPKYCVPITGGVVYGPFKPPNKSKRKDTPRPQRAILRTEVDGKTHFVGPNDPPTDPRKDKFDEDLWNECVAQAEEEEALDAHVRKLDLDMCLSCNTPRTFYNGKCPDICDGQDFAYCECEHHHGSKYI